MTAAALPGENDERQSARCRRPPEREARDERDLTGHEEPPQMGLSALVGLMHYPERRHEPDDHRDRT
jgi:hypothetical protein